MENIIYKIIELITKISSEKAVSEEQIQLFVFRILNRLSVLKVDGRVFEKYMSDLEEKQESVSVNYMAKFQQNLSLKKSNYEEVIAKINEANNKSQNEITLLLQKKDELNKQRMFLYAEKERIEGIIQKEENLISEAEKTNHHLTNVLVSTQKKRKIQDYSNKGLEVNIDQSGTDYKKLNIFLIILTVFGIMLAFYLAYTLLPDTPNK